MITYRGNPETVHFVNWVLHSGYVDPLALADKAVGMTDMENEDAAETMRDRLADLLLGAMEGWANEFAPDYEHCAADDVEAAAESYTKENYRGACPNCLFAPLLYSAIERIDVSQAADHIFVYAKEVLSAPGPAPSVN